MKPIYHNYLVSLTRVANNITSIYSKTYRTESKVGAKISALMDAEISLIEFRGAKLVEITSHIVEV